jgi:hypothetical protein
LIAATLPDVAFCFVKGLDPNQPRHHVVDLIGQSTRAYRAHLNGLETFPLFGGSLRASDADLPVQRVKALLKEVGPS